MRVSRKEMFKIKIEMVEALFSPHKGFTVVFDREYDLEYLQMFEKGLEKELDKIIYDLFVTKWLLACYGNFYIRFDQCENKSKISVICKWEPSRFYKKYQQLEKATIKVLEDVAKRICENYCLYVPNDPKLQKPIEEELSKGM